MGIHWCFWFCFATHFCWFALDSRHDLNMMFAVEIEGTQLGTLPAMFVHSQSCLSNGNHTQPRHFVFCAVDQTGS
jgi:hypothetical protein